MVVEKFRNGDALPVYRRFRDGGCPAPDGLTYVSSWVHESLDRGYQLMETTDIEEWMAHWKCTQSSLEEAGENIVLRL